MVFGHNAVVSRRGVEGMNSKREVISINVPTSIRTNYASAFTKKHTRPRPVSGKKVWREVMVKGDHTTTFVVVVFAESGSKLHSNHDRAHLHNNGTCENWLKFILKTFFSSVSLVVAPADYDAQATDHVFGLSFIAIACHWSLPVCLSGCIFAPLALFVGRVCCLILDAAFGLLFCFDQELFVLGFFFGAHVASHLNITADRLYFLRAIS